MSSPAHFDSTCVRTLPFSHSLSLVLSSLIFNTHMHLQRMNRCSHSPSFWTHTFALFQNSVLTTEAAFYGITDSPKMVDEVREILIINKHNYISFTTEKYWWYFFSVIKINHFTLYLCEFNWVKSLLCIVLFVWQVATDVAHSKSYTFEVLWRFGCRQCRSYFWEHNFSLSVWEGLCWEGSRKLVEFTVDRRLVVDSNLSTHSGWQRFVVAHVISAPSTNCLSFPDALHLLSLSRSCLLSLWEPRASNTIKFSILYKNCEAWLSRCHVSSALFAGSCH